MNFLIDENMPRSLCAEITAAGFEASDARDIGLRGRPDNEVFATALAADSIIITRDRGFANPKNWPPAFTAGVILINLPEESSARSINSRVLGLLMRRTPDSLAGNLTTVEFRRALSRPARKRL